MAAEKGNTTQTTSPSSSSLQVQSKPYHPGLLMAARRGDWELLECLLPRLVTAADYGFMPRGDSLLHVVASRGDGEEFLRSAEVIHLYAGYLLHIKDKNGDTPLHCAARAGRRGMVAHLVSLARSDNDDEKVKVLLRTQNMRRETVLHEAVRFGDGDMVGLLMAEDPQLARVPPSALDASPLYLAVELGRHHIARQLYHKDPALSYSGPDGRNALHAAVLEGQDPTKMLLEWNKDLIKEADFSNGSTPLHFAASWGMHKVISLLLAADPSAAYQPDNNGSFPIHMAAFANEVGAVKVLLDGTHHDCAELRDAKGRTFLHVAVQEGSVSVVTHACIAASSVVNMRDDDGNTALHLAVMVGNLEVFTPLIKNRLVELNVTNDKGQRPLDLSWIRVPFGFRYGFNARIMIHNLLHEAGAKNGTHRGDLFCQERITRLDEKEEAQKITASTQIVGIGSVLIATVAFAAAFTLPGGYRGDDQENGGTPMLVAHPAFHVFIIADTLAFIISSLSITLLTYAGIADVDIHTRRNTLITAAFVMAGSARSLSAAFVFGLYVVLAPVARTTVVASFAITALASADAIWFIWRVCTNELILLKRLGARAWWRLAWAVLTTLLGQFWPYIVIAGVMMCVKIKRDH